MGHGAVPRAVGELLGNGGTAMEGELQLEAVLAVVVVADEVHRQLLSVDEEGGGSLPAAGSGHGVRRAVGGVGDLNPVHDAA